MSPYDPDALIIDGAEVQPRSTQYIDVISPSAEKVIGRAPAAGPEDVALAVGAARAAYERGDWRRMPVSDRVAILERAVDSLESRTAEIAHLVTSQAIPTHLRPLLHGDRPRCAVACEAILKRYGASVCLPSPGSWVPASADRVLSARVR